MRNFTRTLLIVFMILFTIDATAQNKVTLNDGKLNYRSIETSKNTTITKLNNNVIHIGNTANITSNDKTMLNTHLLSIRPEGMWDVIAVASTNGYQNMVFAPDAFEFEEELEEGVYDILINCYIEEDDDFFWSLYEVNLNDDITISPNANADAIYTISTNCVDENGNTLANLPIRLMYYDLILHWIGGDELIWGLCGDEYWSELPMFRFNSLINDCFLYTDEFIATEDQRFYYIELPTIIGELNENAMFENNPDDFKINHDYFTIEDDSDATFHLHYNQFFEDHYINTKGWNENLIFDSQLPLTTITNIKIQNPTSYESEPIKVKLMPCVLEVIPEFDMYEDKVVTAPFYYDAQDNFIREPFDLLNINLFKEYESHDYFTPSPIANEMKNSNIVDNSGRTPLLYYQMYGFNENSSLYGVPSYEGKMAFLGNCGSERYGDESARIEILHDGVRYFEDSLYYFNWYDNYYEGSACKVQMNVKNNHLVIDNIQKSNNTTIEFDLNKEDVIPPTMTILQVLDSNNQENIEILDIEKSKVNFAAGDFSGYTNEWMWVEHMQYDAKPSVEVYYSTDDSNWEAIEYAENEAMFHVNYGNYFTVDLSQLDGKVSDQWVSMKFVITDEAGNFQEQELMNLFYAGELTNVSESNATTSTVYPNPFQTSFTVNAVNPVSGKAVVNVYNVLGENVYTKAMNCSETTEFVIDGSSLNAGIYFYSINTENGTLQGRIVKE